MGTELFRAIFLLLVIGWVLIGVPIAIAALTFCVQSVSARWLAVLLGASEDDLIKTLPAK